MVDADTGTGRNVGAVDGFTAERNFSGEREGHWRVETQRFGEHGFHVCQVVGACDGDLGI